MIDSTCIVLHCPQDPKIMTPKWVTSYVFFYIAWSVDLLCLLSRHVFVLDGPLASKSLSVKSGQHFEPGSSTFGDALGPGVPARVDDESMNVLC